MLSESIEKNPLFIKIVNIMRYSLYGNRSIYQQLRKSKKLDLSDSGLPKHIIDEIMKSDATVKQYIKKYGELQKYKSGKFAPKFDWSSIIDDSNVVWQRIESQIDYGYGRMEDDMDSGKPKQDTVYKDLSSQYVATVGSLEVYKSETMEGCISYAQYIGGKTGKTYRHCIFTKNNNMFYDYRYRDEEAAIFFVYDSSLPVNDPKHLLTVIIYPFKSGYRYMITEADNNHKTEKTNLDRTQILSEYPKLKSVIELLESDEVPKSEMAFFKKWRSNIDGLEDEWPSFSKKERMIIAFIVPFHDIPENVFKDMTAHEQKVSVSKYHGYFDDKMYYYKTKDELPELAKDGRASIIEYIDNPSVELQRFLLLGKEASIEAIKYFKKIDDIIIKELVYEGKDHWILRAKVPFSKEIQQFLYKEIGRGIIYHIERNGILDKSVEKMLLDDDILNYPLLSNPSKEAQRRWKEYNSED